MKKPVPTPTQAELLAAVCAATAPLPHDEGVTTQEYAAAMGLPIDAARGALARAVRDGKLIKGRAIRPRGDGSPFPMPVYRPV